MNPFPPDIAYGELFINDLSAHTYAWLVLDIRPLYVPAAYRGGNVQIPGEDGRQPVDTYIDEAAHSLSMYLTGACDQDGDEHSDLFAGWLENIGVLRDAWLTPPVLGPTHPAYIIGPDNVTYTAPKGVQVVGLEQSDDFQEPYLKRAALNLIVPDGLFLPESS